MQKKKYPEYHFYSWIDFGYVREINSLPKNLNVGNIPEKVIYQQLLQIPSKKLNELQVLDTNDVFIAGSAFIIENNLVKKFEEIYENKIKMWYQNFICDDDQSVILQLFYENPDIFYLVEDPVWFSLYKHLK